MVLFLAAAALATPDVVMVGNSYTDRNELAAMVDQHLQAMIPRDLEARYTSLTLGGATWFDHVGFLGSKEAWGAAFATPQDVVVLQEQSQVPGFPQADPAWVDSVEACERLVEAAEATGAWPVLFETWGRRDGDADNPSIYPDYVTMQDRLLAGYRAYQAAMAEAGRPVVVAPVGEAFRAVWIAAGADPLGPGSPFVALYASDGSHPSPLGSYLAAAVIAASVTGREPLPVTLAGVDEAAAVALVPVAWQVVGADPFGPNGYRWAMSWDAWFADHLPDAPISELWWTPWVRVTGPVVVAEVALGDHHGVGPGEGRLIVDGGPLEITAELAVGAEGDGAFEVWSGQAEVERITLGAGADTVGVLRMKGGELEVGRVDQGLGTARLRVEGGVLRARGPLAGSPAVGGGALRLEVEGLAIGGDLAVAPGAVLGLPEGAPAAVGGAALLDGAVLEVEGPSARILLTATSVSAVDAVAPEGFSLVVRPDGDREALVLEEGVPADDTDAPGGDPVDDTDPGGCGCGHGGGAGGAWAILMAVWGARRARRGGAR